MDIKSMLLKVHEAVSENIVYEPLQKSKEVYFQQCTIHTTSIIKWVNFAGTDDLGKLVRSWMVGGGSQLADG